jgi:hypothetical protein
MQKRKQLIFRMPIKQASLQTVTITTIVNPLFLLTAHSIYLQKTVEIFKLVFTNFQKRLEPIQSAHTHPTM